MRCYAKCIFYRVFFVYIYGNSGDLVLDKMENLLEHVFVDTSVSFLLIKLQEK